MLHDWDKTEMRAGILVRKIEGRKPLEEIGVKGRMMLKWILNKYDGRL
jgi:hypothetical protein